ncbi:MAG TPA: MATE family efflux transporter [Rhizobium sp.]
MRVHDSYWGNKPAAEACATLRIGGPIIVANIAQIALMSLNLAIVGALGTDVLAGTSLATMAFQSVLLITTGILSATIPLMAKAYGECTDPWVRIVQILVAGVATSILLCLPSWLFLSNLTKVLVSMGINPGTATLAGDVAWMLQWSLLPNFLYIILRSLFSVLQATATVAIVPLCGVAFGVIASYIAVNGHGVVPPLGASGIGVGNMVTMLSIVAVFLLLARAETRKQRSPDKYSIIPRRHDLASIWEIGISIGLMQAVDATIFYLANILMGRFGEPSLAAHSITSQIYSTIFVVAVGIGLAATVRVGLTAGAGDKHATRRAGWMGVFLSAGIMGAFSITTLLFPDFYVSLFIDLERHESAAALQQARAFLFAASFALLLDGIQVGAIGALRGLGDTRTPMLIAAFGYAGVGLPSALLLSIGFDMKGVGIWYGMDIGIGVIAVLTLLRWRGYSARI